MSINNSLEKIAYDWVKSDASEKIEDKYYCATRDIFQARLDGMVNFLSSDPKIAEGDAYMLAAIAAEIGNNSFDHNLGSWPDISGIFFSYDLSDARVTIVLADRGQGVLKTLKRVKPELENDEGALFTAFHERISGRAPEPRGNGLKFVREAIEGSKRHLTFISGSAKIELNEKVNISHTETIHGCLAVINHI